MKCPICGETLRPGKKDPNYLLCYSCKKKFKAPQKRKSDQGEEQRYSNIPPKAVREKREREMKKAYDDMLAVEDNRSRRKRAKMAEPEPDEALYDDDYDDYDDDEGFSKVPIIILGIAIVIAAAVVVYLLMT